MLPLYTFRKESTTVLQKFFNGFLKAVDGMIKI